MFLHRSNQIELLKEQCDLLNSQMTTDLVTEKPIIYIFSHRKALITATMKITILISLYEALTKRHNVCWQITNDFWHLHDNCHIDMYILYSIRLTNLLS